MNETDITTRTGKCDACGQTSTVIEIGLNWACKDSQSCQKLIEGRIQAAGMTGYDDLADDFDAPQKRGKFTSKPKRHLRFEDGRI